MPVLPLRDAQPDPVRHRFDADERTAPDRGDSGPQVIAVGRADPRLFRRPRRHQGPGEEPVPVGRRQGDRLMTRLDVQAGEHRHPRLVRRRGQDLLHRIRKHGPLQHGDQHTGRVSAERRLDDSSLLPRRRRIIDDLGNMLVEQPRCLVGPDVEDRLDRSEAWRSRGADATRSPVPPGQRRSSGSPRQGRLRQGAADRSRRRTATHWRSDHCVGRRPRWASAQNLAPRHP